MSQLSQLFFVNQIDARLTFVATQRETAKSEPRSIMKEHLLDLVADRVKFFGSNYLAQSSTAQSTMHIYSKVEGCLGGYLASELSAIAGLAVV